MEVKNIMIVVTNGGKKVITLKAFGMKSLRLLPGPNNVDLDNLDDYTNGNEAALGHFDPNKGGMLSIYKGELSADDKKRAEDAKEKNDALNKSSFALKKTQEKLLKAEKKGSSDDKQIKKLTSKLDEMQKTIDELQDAATKGK